MADHRHPLTAVLLCGQYSPDVVDAVSAVLPKSCNLNVIQPSALFEDPQSSDAPSVGSPDFVVIDESLSVTSDKVQQLVRDSKWVIQSQPAEEFSCMTGFNEENALSPVAKVPVMDSRKGGRHVLLLAQNRDSSVNSIYDGPLDVTVLHESSKTEDEQLLTCLSRVAHTVKSATLDQLTLPEGQANQVVIIDDSHGTLLARPSDQTFEAIKSLIQSNLPMVWLTRGVRQGRSVFGGMVQGFLRAIRSEQASARIVLLDIDEDEQPADITEAIVRILQDVPTKDSGRDTEFWMQGGILNIARVVSNDRLNREWASSPSMATIDSETKYLPDGVRLKCFPLDGQFTLKYDDLETPTALQSDEAEIQVLASEIPSSPNAPVVIFGRVLCCGSSVPADVTNGDQVIAWTTDSLATIVRTTSYIRCELSTNRDTGSLLAGLAAVSKVATMCINTARVGSSDRILALPGPASTNHALVALGKAMRWNVSLLARSLEEREEYIQEFNMNSASILLPQDAKEVQNPLPEKTGRWVILAHDFSPLSQEVWRQLSAGGVFVLDDAVLETAPDPLPLSRGASFMPTSLKNLSPTAASAVLQQSLDLVERHPELAEDVGAVYDVSQLTKSSNLLREVPATKVGVITYRYNDSVVRVTPQAPRLTFSSDASYLLVGCLGGLGRSLTRFMMERGARHFVFVSRSGTDKPEAAQVVDLLISAGASARVFRADAGSEVDMVRIVQEIHPDRPIRGVVHAAMVLQDGVFEQMNAQRFQAAVDPKVLGAISLSKALQDVDLDFFVMTSSISATLGNPGQSNYSAANSFLDTLAWQRRLNGQAGVSLVLPMVLDVGVVAENAAIEASLLRKCMYGIDEQEMLRGFEVAMSCVASAVACHEEVGDTQIILGLEPAELAKTVHLDQAVDAYWYQDARFAHLRTETERISQTASPSSAASGGLQSLLASAAGPEDTLIIIAQHIAKRVSSILLISAEDFDLDGPSIARYGLDSMIGAEMRNWLFNEFALEFSFQKLLSPSLTFKGLADVVATHLGLLPCM